MGISWRRASQADTTENLEVLKKKHSWYVQKATRWATVTKKLVRKTRQQSEIRSGSQQGLSWSAFQSMVTTLASTVKQIRPWGILHRRTAWTDLVLAESLWWEWIEMCKRDERNSGRNSNMPGERWPCMDQNTSRGRGEGQSGSEYMLLLRMQ